MFRKSSSGTYDAHGNLLTIASSNANGASMTYTYDVLNRLASANDNRVAAQGGPSAPTTYSYDPAGNLSGYAYPNALHTGNGVLCNPIGRIKSKFTFPTAEVITRAGI